MTIQKPSIPKGTRDFGVSEMIRRNYIFSIIRSVFQLYGYKPIETPAVENLATLMGKYGEEGDRLIFKILNSGDFLSEIPQDKINQLSSNEAIKFISEKALRYDLTVPFARYVVMHQNEITFPFKRYQIQPVWRADRPQKGRYREFYQCDVDVIGSDSLLNEFELIQMVDSVFNKLNIDVVIKINNRKILSAIAEIIGEPDKIIDITVSIDKIDKIGVDAVYGELRQKNISEEAIYKLQPIINLKGSSEQKIAILKEVLQPSAFGLKGIEEIESIFEYLKNVKIKAAIDLDLTLARGLNYYTGAIFEVKAKGLSMGSIAGGGRYDDLTGIFGLKNISGVGISFGADRIYDVLNEQNLFPKDSFTTTQILFVNFGLMEEKYCISIVDNIRKEGINAELYPVAAKLKKQMDYANLNHIPFVAIIGSEEMSSQQITLKNMQTGEQLKMNFPDLINYLKD